MPNFYITYHPKYNIKLMGFEHLHPFDTQKYGKVWKVLEDNWADLKHYHVDVDRGINTEELLMVHSQDYLQSLKKSTTIAEIVEVSQALVIPAMVLDQLLLKPMRWAVRGSVLSAIKAMQENAMVVNLGGGFHHAKMNAGGGFCFYSDAVLMINTLIKEKLLQEDTMVLYIDLDVHQGNGVCDQFQDNKNIKFFDMYNADIYPNAITAQKRLDYNIALHTGCTDELYLSTLQQQLPKFLNEFKQAKFVIYNAGSDIYEKDLLGGLAISKQGIIERDNFVLEQIQHLPSVMLLSGGYGPENYHIIADSLLEYIKN